MEMSVSNQEIADMFERLADLLEIDGENPFKVRAYRNASRTISSLSKRLADMIERGEDLTQLPGIGKEIAKKIQEIVETGTLSKLKEVESHVPPSLVELLRIPGLGPKGVQAVYKSLNVRTIEDLKNAAESGKLARIPGFGEKKSKKILEEIDKIQQVGKRYKLAVVEKVAEPLLQYLKEIDGVHEAMVAGSYRRKKETVGDLDILVTCNAASLVKERFLSYESVGEILSQGETRCSVRLRDGLQVDLRVVPEECYGAALHYFTGSQAHNIAIRRLGVERGLKINEYGVFKGEARIAGKKEEDVFESVGLPYIEPELREDRGEIEAAKAGRLPKLVTIDSIKGDLHAHTKATDGYHTVEEMALAAKERGYRYIAISDHSKRLTVTRGLDERRLWEQMKEIDSLNERLDGFVVLKSIEVDIMEDGSLDLSDDVLKDLDFVIGAVHHKFNLSREKQTERIIKAMDNPHFTILAHPTGRLIGERDGYDVDMERLVEAAKERGCILELNAHPDRLDLTDEACRLAKEAGVRVAISTDAHAIGDLSFMRYGINQARRGWLEADDVVNTLPFDDLKRALRRFS
jgi:DNA polymerase (family 10)